MLLAFAILARLLLAFAILGRVALLVLSFRFLLVLQLLLILLLLLLLTSSDSRTVHVILLKLQNAPCWYVKAICTGPVE